MSSLQLPPSTVDLMDKKRRAFLWSGDKTGHSSLASCLVVWINVCYPKDLGGLGIRDLGVENICLLLKLLHRLHCPQSSAWAQWVHNRASITTLSGDLHGDHWQTLKALLPLYQAITSVVIGDGNNCSFWNDVWIGDECLADKFPALFSHCHNKLATVCEIKTSGLQSTLVPRLSLLADQQLQSVQELLDQTSLSMAPDKRTSVFLRPDYSLDSGALYKMIKARGQGTDPRAIFSWKSLAPPRVKLFMWLLLQRRIQCRSVLFRKHIVDSTTCEICNASEESPEHIIHGCPLGKEVWTKLNLQSMIPLDMCELHTISNSPSAPIPEFSTFIALICWHIWKARNAKVFRNESQSVDRVLLDCKAAAELWQFRFPRAKRQSVTHWCTILQMARQGQG